MPTIVIVWKNMTSEKLFFKQDTYYSAIWWCYLGLQNSYQFSVLYSFFRTFFQVTIIIFMNDILT